MKYLGIDYGSKRVGIATSDEGGKIAFPKVILPRDAKLLDEIQKICTEEEIGEIVIGESVDYKGQPNSIMKDILIFKTALLGKVSLPVHFEPEFMTSHEASKNKNRMQTMANEREDGRAGRKPQAKESVDASAAALILQNFLDKKK
ncbi:MAG: Holliday junction resolvase RuvX [Candidatus Pacebacteria bacterium]|nr:Holliday junction resolvase RuvX [Candidatus Paceibacterota bacterium]MDD5356872.1 Holliday junction resolvase RuvX [Candidatus Paceibacterota bacterium]